MLHRLNRLGLLLPLLLPLTTHCRTPAGPDASGATGLTGSSELPDISQVGVEAVVKWSKTRLGEAEADFSRRGTPRLPVEYACFRAEGPDKHPRFRQDMFLSGMFRLGSSVPKIDALAYIGPPQQTPSPRWQEDPFLDRSHSLYQTTRRFLRLRRSCHALRYGDIAWRWVSEQPGGLLAFSRLDHDKEALVVGNLQSGEVALPDLTVSRSGVEFVNLASPTQLARPSGEGRVSFQGLKIPGRSILVFVPRTSVGRRMEELGTNFCSDDVPAAAH